MAKKIKKPTDDQTDKPKVYGDPEYSAKDDIYSREKKESFDDSEEEFEKDLDVPGSELDDADEKIGEEDEENNYYSLGGDDHDDLEEDKGE
jgi:hypothetical protein